MGPKTTSNLTSENTTEFVSTETLINPRWVSLSCVLNGTPPGTGEFNFYAIFEGMILLEERWNNDTILEVETLPINLNDPQYQNMVASSPLILLLRFVTSKGTKDPNPLNHPENRAGASVDLFPLLLGEEKIFVTSHLVSLSTGERTDCSVEVIALSPGTKDNTLVPLMITMISAHCLPIAKDGTVYLSAIGLNEVHMPIALNFNMSLSTNSAEKIVFAAVSTAGHTANTAMNVHCDDMFIPDDLQPQDDNNCRSYYWNAMNRVLVEPDLLYKRLSSPFMIDVAGVPRTGKVDIRGRYMGLVDAKVLLEPGQMSVTVCSKLLFFNENNTPDNVGPLLEVRPMSAKASGRTDVDQIVDEYGHPAYVVLRFDLTEALVPKTKLKDLFEKMGFSSPDRSAIIFNDSISGIQIQVPDSIIDASHIRKAEGALAVHKELGGLACKGVIPMNQGIKRTAANRLVMRVRALLKSFPPEDCSYLDWQDTVTGQHAASRRAVTASFAPQPPPLRLPDKFAAARCRIAGDYRIADKHIQTNLKVAGSHPRSLIVKTLRCLEERNDIDAKNYLLEALSRQSRNRYLLWMIGGLEFDQEDESAEVARAALHIAVKGDISDGTANAIGWAALHAYHHNNEDMYAAFVAAKKMRKSFLPPMEWKKMLYRWTETSGEEEISWMPSVITSNNPMVYAAAFFLCLRCYKFSERLLQCVDQDCTSHGSVHLKCHITPDVYYLRAASLILRRELDSAMEMTLDGIKKFGPTPILSQMRVSCLTRNHIWNHACEKALQEAEKAGSELCPSLLYSASLFGFKTNPLRSLQRIARAHKMSPSAHTALLIGRIYALLGEKWLAERWIAAAVNNEPLLADGWAMLALLALHDRNVDKARVMLRTARQLGHISPDIDDQVKKANLDRSPDFLVNNLCLCEYY